MAVVRTLQHRMFKPAWMHRTGAASRGRWRPVVLILLAILAAALASYSLIVNPPDTPPPHPSYLPSSSLPSTPVH